MTQIIGNPKGVLLCITTCGLALACSQDTLVPLGKDQHPGRAQWPMPMRGAPFHLQASAYRQFFQLQPWSLMLFLDFLHRLTGPFWHGRSQTVVRQDSPPQRLIPHGPEKVKGISVGHLRRMMMMMIMVMVPISSSRAASASDCIAPSAIDCSHLSIARLGLGKWAVSLHSSVRE